MRPCAYPCAHRGGEQLFGLGVGRRTPVRTSRTSATLRPFQSRPTTSPPSLRAARATLPTTQAAPGSQRPLPANPRTGTIGYKPAQPDGQTAPPSRTHVRESPPLSVPLPLFPPVTISSSQSLSVPLKLLHPVTYARLPFDGNPPHPHPHSLPRAPTRSGSTTASPPRVSMHRPFDDGGPTARADRRAPRVHHTARTHDRPRRARRRPHVLLLREDRLLRRSRRADPLRPPRDGPLVHRGRLMTTVAPVTPAAGRLTDGTFTARSGLWAKR
jgi:hypothetical protein